MPAGTLMPPWRPQAGFWVWENSSPVCTFLPWESTAPSSPSGMMERYFPRNLLEMVISCQRLQPFLESTWCAADGGWWLT